MKEPQISVGIVSGEKIRFTLNGEFTILGKTIHGEQTISYQEGCILWNNEPYDELTFTPQEEDSYFSLHEVTIGINFHWERQETQSFKGALKLVIDNHKIHAINLISVEDYLTSVISSEMSATSSSEFLKAHAVISRSWLFAQMEKRKALSNQKGSQTTSIVETDTEFIRWYDREDHTIFDVCADDHCQRYQGITKASSPTVAEAIQATRGELIMYGNEICDARFSKCCGGITEEFKYCWEDKQYPYLKAICDTKDDQPPFDLTIEAEAEQWIRTSPPSFCHTNDKKVLSQILNNFDQETTQFYRWEVSYTQEELAELIRNRTETDYGQIIDLIPIERGKSGRISKLKIVGTKKTMIIGKELEIRRTLSNTHLFSSAFVVDKAESNNGIPDNFTLIGAGWGHGVGLCQIGAAVMGEEGYPYDEILSHYYPGSNIQKIY